MITAISLTLAIRTYKNISWNSNISTVTRELPMDASVNVLKRVTTIFNNKTKHTHNHLVDNHAYILKSPLTIYKNHTQSNKNLLKVN